MKRLRLLFLAALMAALLCYITVEAHAATDISNSTQIKALLTGGGEGRLIDTVWLGGSNVTIPSGVEVKLDLNGKALQTYGYSIIVDGGSLIVSDTSSGGNGYIYNGYGTSYEPPVEVRSGALTLMSGRITGGGQGGVTITGGSFTMVGGILGGRDYAFVSKGGTTTLSSGTIRGAWNGESNPTYGIKYADGTIIYSGTKFESNYTDIVFYSSGCTLNLLSALGNRVISVALSEDFAGSSHVFTNNLMLFGKVSNFTVPHEGFEIRASFPEAQLVRKYGVTVSSPTGITLSADKQWAEYNETVTVSLDSLDSNYQLSEVNYTTADGTTTAISKNSSGKYPFNMPAANVTVSAKLIPTVTAPTAKNLTYSGTAQNLVNAGSTYGGTMQYALGTESAAPTSGWSADIPTGVNAVTYYVWYRVQGGSGYVDVPAAGPVTVTIATAPLSIKPKDQTIIPGGAINDNPNQIDILLGWLMDGDRFESITLTPSNTLALTANGTITPSAAKIVNASGADVTGNYEIRYNNSKLTVAIPFTGSGTAQSPYRIGSEEEWMQLAVMVNAGFETTGLSFLLIDSVNVSASVMVGTEDHSFKGSFDGGGHTLHLSITSDVEYCAPFRFVSGAVFSNLIIDGTINTSNQNAAGLVGRALGACTVTNCVSDVDIFGSGGGGHTGFVSNCTGGTVSVRGSAFTGSITGANAGYCAGFLGYGGSTVDDCIYDGSMATKNDSNDFIRTKNYAGNCYSINLTGIDRVKGKQAYSVTAAEGLNVDFGEGTVYDVSGITAYKKGLVYNGVFYAGQGDEVALGLSVDQPAPRGFGYRYQADRGKLDQTDTGWKLTMPAEDVELSAVAVPVFGEPDFILPASLTEIGEEAFVDTLATVVDIPEHCTVIGEHAFQYAVNLFQIRIPAGCSVGWDAFDGCEMVYVFGYPNSSAQSYCEDHDNCEFVNIGVVS